jgi:hypothetical protein
MLAGFAADYLKPVSPKCAGTRLPGFYWKARRNEAGRQDKRMRRHWALDGKDRRLGRSDVAGVI